jgi:hypothetical protein
VRRRSVGRRHAVRRYSYNEHPVLELLTLHNDLLILRVRVRRLHGVTRSFTRLLTLLRDDECTLSGDRLDRGAHANCTQTSKIDYRS